MNFRSLMEGISSRSLAAVLASIVVSASTMVPAHAIVNIEEMRMDETSPGWASSATLSFSGKRGNIHEDKFALNGGLQWVSDDLKFRNLLLLTFNRDSAEGTTFSRDLFAHLRHTRQLTATSAWETFVQHQAEPLNADYRRQLLGTNGRFAVNQRFIQGYFGAGVMYEKRRVIPASYRVERDDWRFNLYLNSRYELSDTAEFAVSFYVQPKVSNLSDVRSTVNAGITSRITRLFALTLDVTYANETEPLFGQAHDEWSYSMGVNMRF